MAQLSGLFFILELAWIILIFSKWRRMGEYLPHKAVLTLVIFILSIVVSRPHFAITAWGMLFAFNLAYWMGREDGERALAQRLRDTFLRGRE